MNEVSSVAPGRHRDGNTADSFEFTIDSLVPGVSHISLHSTPEQATITPGTDASPLPLPMPPFMLATGTRVSIFSRGPGSRERSALTSAAMRVISRSPS